MEASRTQVQMDFDGVFVSRDSTVTFILRRLRRRPLLVPLALLPALAYAATVRVPRVQNRLARVLVRVALLGLSPQAAGRALDALGRELAVSASLVPRALEVARAHVASGDRVVVNSAAMEPLLHGFVAAAGLDVQVVGSTLRGVAGGTAMDRHNHDHEKVEQARRLGLREPYDVVYSDSASDLPLLERATRAVLVDASEGTRTRVRAAVRGEVVEECWRR